MRIDLCLGIIIEWLLFYCSSWKIISVSIDIFIIIIYWWCSLQCQIVSWWFLTPYLRFLLRTNLIFQLRLSRDWLIFIIYFLCIRLCQLKRCYLYFIMITWCMNTLLGHFYIVTWLFLMTGNLHFLLASCRIWIFLFQLWFFLSETKLDFITRCFVFII